ncbi:3' terminal RNA ribose 2'-O-methyltransferase Hen1 [Priestia flexa]|uniref:3' terminal RNA ribose 2'-O-methyltransferase Hen1 n=1 Tax=Priestia flexa TaxID=86664 RepID=UPI001CD3F549|nr:3' terminal RNA ribose 2'-O-methyltransferase Hen1 [Priestia flexa]MCA1202572.1 3' terminal RNA ribose 2'-O-methyltransferase Hen1 [Priestia flexa]
MQLSMKVKGEGAENVSRLIAKNPSNPYERMEKGQNVRLAFTTFEAYEAEFIIYVDVDPIELVKSGSNHFDITHYINDREFAVSSLFCSYIRKALGTALNGKPKEEYSEWVHHAFDLEVSFGPIASHLPDQRIQELFEPMGYAVEIERRDIDYTFDLKTRSTARYVTLKGIVTVQQALQHLFILIPVLDNFKHYFLDEREIEKIERYGEGWLDAHPLKRYIYEQSLRFKDLVKQANVATNTEKKQKNDDTDQAKTPLNELRYQAILKKVQSLPAKGTVVDFGSGEGKLATRLGFIPGIGEILAVEPSQSAQLKALERFEKAAAKPNFIQPRSVWGSLFYYDAQLQGADVIILCEVIEHINEERLPGIMNTIFTFYQPKSLIVTTPNQEYNVVYQMNETMRHADHRFEWNRREFASWCEAWTQDFPYSITIEGIGEENDEYGSPTQMCTFERKEGDN